jgi:hypothetical protein
VRIVAACCDLFRIEVVSSVSYAFFVRVLSHSDDVSRVGGPGDGSTR